MSKQSDAKLEQKYQLKPKFPMCSNCKFFKSDKKEGTFGYIKESNIRCGLGGFAIKKQGTCEKHDFQTA